MTRISVLTCPFSISFSYHLLFLTAGEVSGEKRHLYHALHTPKLHTSLNRTLPSTKSVWIKRFLQLFPDYSYNSLTTWGRVVSTGNLVKGFIKGSMKTKHNIRLENQGNVDYLVLSLCFIWMQLFNMNARNEMPEFQKGRGRGQSSEWPGTGWKCCFPPLIWMDANSSEMETFIQLEVKPRRWAVLAFWALLLVAPNTSNGAWTTWFLYPFLPQKGQKQSQCWSNWDVRIYLRVRVGMIPNRNIQMGVEGGERERDN